MHGFDVGNREHGLLLQGGHRLSRPDPEIGRRVSQERPMVAMWVWIGGTRGV